MRGGPTSDRQRRGRLAALFLFALVLFNPPLLTLFRTPDGVFGIPGLVLYIFLGWAAVILGIALATGRGDYRGER